MGVRSEPDRRRIDLVPQLGWGIAANPPDQYAPWDGPISEVRLSRIGRPDEWIEAQAEALHDLIGSPFVVFGPEMIQ
jgi:hypothetical protein